MSVQGQKPSGAGKFGLGIVVGLVVGALLVGVGVFVGLVSLGGAGGSDKLEGEGFESAEDAAVAYLEVLQTLDQDALIQLHRIESFVEKCDGAAYLRHMRYYSLSVPGCPVPDDVGELGENINIALRHREVTNYVGMMITTVGTPSSADNPSGTMLADDDAIAELQDRMVQEIADVETGFSDIQVGDAADLIDAEDLARLQESMADQAKMLGVSPDDMEAVLLTFEFRGQTHTFAPLVINDDGRWYIQTSQSPISQYLGIPIPGIGVL